MSKNTYSEYEQSRIDYRVNKYTLKCLAVTFIGMIAIWLANVAHIFIVNMELLSEGIFCGCVIVFITFLFGKCVDLHKPWVKYILVFNTIVAITILGVTLTYHTVLISVFPLLIAAQYSDKKMIIYTYILSIVSVFVIVTGGYFFGLCDANMLTLTTEPTAYYRNHATGELRIQISNSNPWYTLIVYYVVPRCVILLLMLPVVQNISENILEYAAYAGRMKRRSERDEMTGLYNRNKFLRMVKEEYPKVERVSAIFWDVNNLKDVNDNLGHDKGDFVICEVAQVIMALTDTDRKAYRTGGDEFVMIVENPSEGEVEELLFKWERKIKQKSSSINMELSIAIGCASGNGGDIDAIIKEADQKMYLKKHEQKKQQKEGKS